MASDSQLLRPMPGLVSATLRTLVGLSLLTFIWGRFDSRIGGPWGGASLCVDADWISVGVGSDHVASHLKGRSTVDFTPRFCASHATSYQHLLQTAVGLSLLVVTVGGLYLLNKALSTAARDGVYTRQTAARLANLGRWMLFVPLAGSLLVANVQALLLATLTTLAPLTAGGWTHFWHVPYLSMLTGAGLIVFARITRAGSDMREDLDGVV
ncbi:DUF2975 domain-containing protein [Streptomyces sp. NPDC046985]|uniref:DUF2975 domain-containing protein n=1 Tax=Streptomyces sp. NPDC046985 TaxID=3155377 RepID=UPI0033E1D2E9